MVRHHVAQRAGAFVEPAAAFHTDRLGDGDLHVVDAVAVPQRLEQPVGEAEGHDALDRFLPQEVVDPVDLLLPQFAADAGVQRPGRGQVVAERLLDHHPAPALRLAVAQLLVQQAGMAQLLDGGAEEAVADRQVEQHVAVGLAVLGDVVQVVAQLLEAAGIVQVALHIGHGAGQALPGGLVDRIDAAFAGGVADEALQHVVQAVGPGGGVLLHHVHADDGEVLGQQAGVRQVVQRRHQQALGQVAAGAEDHHGAGAGRLGRAPRRGGDVDGRVVVVLVMRYEIVPQPWSDELAHGMLSRCPRDMWRPPSRPDQTAISSVPRRRARQKGGEQAQAGQHREALQRQGIAARPVAQHAGQQRAGGLRQHLHRQRNAADRAVAGAAEIVRPGQRQHGQQPADAQPEHRGAPGTRSAAHAPSA